MSTYGSTLVVVGAGPAGLSAAAAAADAGLNVTLIDESDRLGGQYFRGRQHSAEAGSPRAFAVAKKKVRVLSGAVVVDAPEQGRLAVWVQPAGVVEDIAYGRLVIATGAYDRAIAIPGWTLPGVMSAGGASTLAKVHGLAAGKRVLVAGSGPFLLAAADDLSAKGCSVEVVEATSWAASARGLGIIARDPEIAAQTIGYLARLSRRRIGRRYGEIVTRIHGRERVESVTVHAVDEDWRPVPGGGRKLTVDAVCLGYGFVPQLELAQALGCGLRRDGKGSNDFVTVDEAMRTSAPNIYAAGEVTGGGGKRIAVAQGTLAGLSAARDADALSREAHEQRAGPVRARLKTARRLADWIGAAFAPRDHLFALATPDTILCRCEDVRCADVAAALSANPPTPSAVKIATRLGMGICQGRICAPYLIEWLRTGHAYAPPADERPWSIRPPIRPVPIGAWLGGRYQ